MGKQRQPGMGLESETNENDNTPRKLRQDNRPICPVHQQQQMTAYSTNAMFTYYRCPVDGCRQSAKRVRKLGPLKTLYGNADDPR